MVTKTDKLSQIELDKASHYSRFYKEPVFCWLDFCDDSNGQRIHYTRESEYDFDEINDPEVKLVLIVNPDGSID